MRLNTSRYGDDGTVKLTSITVMCGAFAMPNTSSRCRGVPRDERARAQKSLIAGAELMSSNGEQVANGWTRTTLGQAVLARHADAVLADGSLHGERAIPPGGVLT